MATLLAAIFVVLNALLGVYTLHILLLTALFFVQREPGEPEAPPSDWPTVTVQLPLFNEAAVLERLLQAVAGLDYPRSRLQVQVLDDSTDDTTAQARVLVEELRSQGLDIELIRRTDRRGFKAGALAHGMKSARGEFLAIFDADFVPQADFLRRCLPRLLSDPGLAFVQARWGHLNRNYSWLTRAQSLAIDSHFLIDQRVRHWAGFPMHFNGTAGIWRRRAIETSGGWHGDTLCEDLDLSYRAQLSGWRPGYLPGLVVPAELTPQLAAFKQQQFRWAKGSIQCWRKLLRPIAGSSLAWHKKALAVVHLSGYLIHPLMLMLALVTPAFALCRGAELLPPEAWLLSVFTLSFPFFYAVALRSEFEANWLRMLLTDLPLLMLVGSGMAVSNSIAVYQGLTSDGGSRFGRTPKFNAIDRSHQLRRHRYWLPLSPTVAGELLVAAYSLAGFAAVLWQGQAWLSLSSLYYAASFGVTAALSLWESR